jgi:hypothetical protein
MKLKILIVSLAVLAIAAGATAAEKKASGEAVCKAEPPAPVAVGDKPGHSFAIGKSHCTWTKFELDGVMYKEGESVSLEEIQGDKSEANGFHTATLANGDKTTAHFHGSFTTKDGKPVGGGGTWTFSSGTGKFSGIQGKGTYKGKANPDGTVTFQVEGEYTLR